MTSPILTIPLQRLRRSFRFLAAGVIACTAFAAMAQSHGNHAGHGAQSPAPKAMSELGTGAAFDRDGRLWIAYKDGQHVAVRASTDQGRSFGPVQHVNRVPEPVAADHYSRPKVAAGRDGEIYITSKSDGMIRSVVGWVPEPTSAILLASGMLLVAATRRSARPA